MSEQLIMSKTIQEEQGRWNAGVDFKQPLTRNPNYNKIDQSRAVLVETRIGPDTLPLATTSPSRHCWGTLVCPLEHCLETSAMSNGSSLNIIRCSVIGSNQGEQLECYTNCLSTK